MKIHSLRIQRFRSFLDQTIVFSNCTCFVGANGAGKSTILTALNIFFKDSTGSPYDLSNLTNEDFYPKDTSSPIVITLTFTELSPSAQDDFADYFRQDKLVVSAEAHFDPSTGVAPVTQFGQRMGLPSFKTFFERDKSGAPAGELKEIYLTLRERYPELPSRNTKPQMIEALHEFESAHPELCELIPSSDQFYGFSRGANRLAKHLQWVFVPAVKDAVEEDGEAKHTVLGKLLERTVRSRIDLVARVDDLRRQADTDYKRILDTHQSILDDMSNALTHRMSRWAHLRARIKLTWRHKPNASVRIEEPMAGVQASEGTFGGSLGRFGHGFQRCYLLALLQELSSIEGTNGPRLILACEEPELYQHPPQARHLASILKTLSEQSAQIMLCTHSPYFVSGQWFDDVRIIRQCGSPSTSEVSSTTFQEIAGDIAAAWEERPPSRELGTASKLHQALQPTLNEMFFASSVVFVEGLEDVAYITSYMVMLGCWDEFRSFGAHLVSTDGKSEIIRPLAIANRLGIPAYVVCDSDANAEDRSGSREKHRKDNRAILHLSGCENENPLPSNDIQNARLTMWASNITEKVASDFGEAWNQIKDDVRRRYGQVGNLDKNVLFIGDTVAAGWDQGLRCSSLQSLCNRLIEFARRNSTNSHALADQSVPTSSNLPRSGSN